MSDKRVSEMTDAEVREMAGAGGDGNPIRDNGPYQDRDQAMAQHAAAAHGMPDPDAYTGHVAEAVLLAGVTLTPYEADQLHHLAVNGHVDQATLQVIAGWIIRGHLAGRDQERTRVSAALARDLGIVAGWVLQDVEGLAGDTAAGYLRSLANRLTGSPVPTLEELAEEYEERETNAERHPNADGFRAFAAARYGAATLPDEAAADAVMARRRRPGLPTAAEMLGHALQDVEDALAWLRRAVEDGPAGLELLPRGFDDSQVKALFRALGAATRKATAWRNRLLRTGAIASDSRTDGRYRAAKR